MRGRSCIVALSAAVALGRVGTAVAWHSDGHEETTLLAFELVEGRMPAFFGEKRDLAAHCSHDPDVFRLYKGTPLRDQEAPEHFIDLEMLGGDALPPKRSEFLALCAARGLNPAEVGYVPYAVSEWTQRLAVALKEHRRWPENPHIRTKCLVYAGILAHYAGDLCMPLHVTVHYDGKAGPAGKSPKSGIHNKVDALLGKLDAPPAEILQGLQAAVFEDVMQGVVREMDASRRLVDAVYALEPKIPAAADPLPNDPALEAFVRERVRAVVAFVASLYLTAWEHSEAVYLPDWHQRTDDKDPEDVHKPWDAVLPTG
jgi:hypothetical protein